MSEIDAIFASKAKPVPLPLPSSSKPSEKAKKKKRKAKAKDVASSKPAGSTTTAAPSAKKRPAPETVVDTSGRLEPAPKRQKGRDDKVSATGKSSKRISNDDADFKDSRGSGNRRTTEEGWSVYKEDELGISGEGGDTPLCPFDCNCCF